MTIERLTDRGGVPGDRSDTLSDEQTLAGIGRSAVKVRQFTELVRSLSPAIASPAPSALEFVISHSGLRAMYKGEGDADDSPSRNLDELISAAAAFQEDNPVATLVS